MSGKFKTVRVPVEAITEMRSYLEQSADPVLRETKVNDSQAAQMLARVAIRTIRGEYETEYRRRTFTNINQACAAAAADVVAAYVNDPAIDSAVAAEVVQYEGWPALRTRDAEGKSATTPMPREIVRPAERTLN